MQLWKTIGKDCNDGSTLIHQRTKSDVTMPPRRADASLVRRIILFSAISLMLTISIMNDYGNIEEEMVYQTAGSNGEQQDGVMLLDTSAATSGEKIDVVVYEEIKKSEGPINVTTQQKEGMNTVSLLHGNKQENYRTPSDQQIASIPSTDDSSVMEKSNITSHHEDQPPATTSQELINTDNTTKTQFKRYDNVVIATKILWENDISILEAWVCFINHAYNDRMKYDFVVFTTMPWKPENIARLQKSAYPANLTVAIEAPPLDEQIAAMTEEEVKFLYDRCSVKENGTISWFHHCKEPDTRHVANLGYSWQAEFRSFHIWTHPALENYKYMMWLDSDAYVGKTWDIDPIQAMVENDLTVLYAGFPYGAVEEQNVKSIKSKIMAVYNTTICGMISKNQFSGVHLSEDYYDDDDQYQQGNETHDRSSPDGNQQLLYAVTCNDLDESSTLLGIAGNHHITNLDVFRKDVHQQFLKKFTGDYRFSRKSDDQLAVTVVALMEQYLVNNRTNVPTKSTVWHELSHGMPLKIAHHGFFDGVRTDRAPRRHKQFYNKFHESWLGLEDKCWDMIH